MVAPTFDRRFWWRHAVLPALILALVTLPFEVSDLDLRLTDPFYDFDAKRWPYIESWWARDVIHNGGKYLIWSLGSLPAFALPAPGNPAPGIPTNGTLLGTQ